MWVVPPRNQSRDFGVAALNHVFHISILREAVHHGEVSFIGEGRIYAQAELEASDQETRELDSEPSTRQGRSGLGRQYGHTHNVVSIASRKRRKMSAAAIARIRAAQKARWTKWR